MLCYRISNKGASMRTRIKKHKLGANKPATQLFLFSNKLNKNIDSYFSGNVIFEIELKGYEYKYHDEAKKVVDFMNSYCLSRAIKPYKFMTVVLNYNAAGLTMASLSGDYDYPIVVHGSTGYTQLATIHTAYETLKHRLNAFEHYASCTLSYVHIAKNEPINLSERSVVSLENQIKKTEQSILKSVSTILATFHKKFQPSYRK
jgi:hypothetical protein